MSLRDTNLRYAALKLIAAMVDDAMKAEKAAHLEALQASAEESDARSWQVRIGDQKVAGITLSQSEAKPRITDEEDLADHLALAHPEMVETITRIKPWAQKQLLDSIVAVTEDGAVTADGELLPGIEMGQPGTPYQSLRWDSKADGKRVMADAIRGGDLRELLSDLPLLDR